MTALESLVARRPSGRIVWGLDRTRAMLESLGDPHHEADVLHIAGTNGKGSAAALAEAALRAAGRRTGLYTSPHLVSLAERIRVDGRPVASATLEACAGEVLPLAVREDASFFEAVTVLAFEAFRRLACDAWVVEVGLGGRLDATNVVAPRVCLITSVDLDHAEYLGATLDRIAVEKAGIVKPGIPVVTGPVDAGPEGVIASAAREAGAEVHRWGEAMWAEDVEVAADGTRFRYRSDGWGDGLALRVPLVGAHQARNASLAARALEIGEWGVTERALQGGFAGASWPGRCETILAGGTRWLLDIAHNPAAARALAGTVRALSLPEPRIFLLAILGDKPWAEMLGPLAEVGDAAVFTVAPSSPEERRWSPEEARRSAPAWAVEVLEDFDAALARAAELGAGGTVIVTGSAHTVGDARARLTSRNAQGVS